MIGKALSTLLLSALLLTAPSLQAASAPSAQIDQMLAASWEKAGLKPNRPASDEVFLRRVYLDVTGRIPTLQETEAFLSSEKKNKRAELIDELLDSEGYVNHYFNYWADILRVNQNLGGGQNIVPFFVDWLRESLEENKPYDQFVQEMVTAEGRAFENGAIGYTYRDRGMPLDHMANTVRIFLGTRMECAQCHNHPFDTWTQMDFFHMAAFSFGMNTNARTDDRYGSIQRKVREMAGDDNKQRQDYQRAFQEITRAVRNNNMIAYDGKRLPQLPHDYQYDDADPKQKIEARTMFGADPEITDPDARLDVYANWMTSEENPRFTTVIANRLWGQAMGMALIEPVDEFTEYTEASHPELLAFLEEQMVTMDYDMKEFLRMIFNTKVYQREATTEEVALGDTYAFTGPLLRRMSAEQIWDSMVSLISADPEMGDWKRSQQFEVRMASQEAMIEALQQRSEQDLVKYTRKVANLQKELRDEAAALTKKAENLRKQGKTKEANEVSREARQVTNRLRAKVKEWVYDPILDEMDVSYASMKMPDGSSMEVGPKMVNENGTPTGDFRNLQNKAEIAMIEKEMESLGNIDEKDRAAYIAFRRNSYRYLRASHVGSPAPAGHFLQAFGQSDRETIENANDEATVPQALDLMNGNFFPQLSSRNSQLHWNLKNVENVHEKIDTVYLSMLSRLPDAEERKVLSNAAEIRGEKIVEDTIFALLNSPEFLFVQ